MNRMLIIKKRPSPRVEGMYHFTSADGTIWAFESKKQMDKFIRQHRDKKEYKHYLSPREIVNLLYGDINLLGGL